MDEQKILLETIHLLEKERKLEQALALGKSLLAEYHASYAPFAKLAPLLLTLTRVASKLRSEECLYFASLATERKFKPKEELHWLSKIMLTKAVYLNSLGKLDEAMVAYEEADGYAQNCGGEHREHLLLYILAGKARTLSLRNEYSQMEKSAEYLQQSLALSRRVGIHMPSNELMLCSLYIELRKPSIARSLIEDFFSRYTPPPEHIENPLAATAGLEYDTLQMYASATTLEVRRLTMKGNLLEALENLVATMHIGIATKAKSVAQYFSAFATICREAGHFAHIYEIVNIALLLVKVFPFTLSENHKFILLLSAFNAAIREGNTTRAEETLAALDAMSDFYSDDNGYLPLYRYCKIHMMLAQKDRQGAIREIQHLENSADSCNGWWGPDIQGFYATCIALDTSLSPEERYSLVQQRWKAAELFATDPEDLMRLREKYVARMHILRSIGAPSEQIHSTASQLEMIDSIFSIPADKQARFGELIALFKLSVYSFAQEQWSKYIVTTEEKFEKMEKHITTIQKKIAQHEKREQSLKQSLQYFSTACIEQDWQARTIQRKIREVLVDMQSDSYDTESVALYSQHLPTPPKSIKTLLLSLSPTLSEKELTFCFLLLEGRDLDTITKSLSIKESSLKKFRYRICRKLNVPKGEQLLYFLRKLMSTIE